MPNSSGASTADSLADPLLESGSSCTRHSSDSSSERAHNILSCSPSDGVSPSYTQLDTTQIQPHEGNTGNIPYKFALGLYFGISTLSIGLYYFSQFLDIVNSSSFVSAEVGLAACGYNTTLDKSNKDASTVRNASLDNLPSVFVCICIISGVTASMVGSWQSMGYELKPALKKRKIKKLGEELKLTANALSGLEDVHQGVVRPAFDYHGLSIIDDKISKTYLTSAIKSYEDIPDDIKVKLHAFVDHKYFLERSSVVFVKFVLTLKALSSFGFRLFSLMQLFMDPSSIVRQFFYETFSCDIADIPYIKSICVGFAASAFWFTVISRSEVLGESIVKNSANVLNFLREEKIGLQLMVSSNFVGVSFGAVLSGYQALHKIDPTIPESIKYSLGGMVAVSTMIVSIGFKWSRFIVAWKLRNYYKLYDKKNGYVSLLKDIYNSLMLTVSFYYINSHQFVKFSGEQTPITVILSLCMSASAAWVIWVSQVWSKEVFCSKTVDEMRSHITFKDLRERIDPKFLWDFKVDISKFLNLASRQELYILIAANSKASTEIVKKLNPSDVGGGGVCELTFKEIESIIAVLNGEPMVADHDNAVAIGELISNLSSYGLKPMSSQGDGLGGVQIEIDNEEPRDKFEASFQKGSDAGSPHGFQRGSQHGSQERERSESDSSAHRIRLLGGSVDRHGHGNGNGNGHGNGNGNGHGNGNGNGNGNGHGNGNGSGRSGCDLPERRRSSSLSALDAVQTQVTFNNSVSSV